MIGLKRRTVEIRDYQKNWSLLFEQMKQEIACSLSNETISIEHIGSTSIDNLAAKPIIDIAVGMPEISEAIIHRLISKLEKISVDYRGNREESGGHLFIKEPKKDLVTHHIHVVKIDGRQWNNYIKFRDELRKDAELKDAYEKLKMKSAHKYPKNRRSYTDSKAEFIRKVIES